MIRALSDPQNATFGLKNTLGFMYSSENKESNYGFSLEQIADIAASRP